MPWKPINPATAAFLGLLQLKNTGRNPEGLLEDVRATIDIEPFYMLGQANLAWRTVASLAANYSGFFAPDLDQFAVNVGTVVVPANEYWWIHEAQTRMVSGIADTITIHSGSTAASIPLGGGINHYAMGDIYSGGWFTPGAAQQVVVPLPMLRATWLPPGSVIGGYIAGADSSNGGAPVAFSATMSVRYTPVPA